MSEYPHGEYVIYVDESGDHSMSAMYKTYRVFVLAFCIFSKKDYAIEVVREIKEFKFSFWGHDLVVLHSSKLRKRIDDFQFLHNQAKRQQFIEKLNGVICGSPFEIISMGIDKRHLREESIEPNNPLISA